MKKYTNHFIGFLPESSTLQTKKSVKDITNLFENPLIHRQIKGNVVFVPLDVNRLWGCHK